MFSMSRRVLCRAPRRMFSAMQHINSRDLLDRIANGAVARGEIVLLDVRDHEEFEKGHIKGSNNLPAMNFDDHGFVDRLINMYSSKNASLVFLCGQGKRQGPSCAQITRDRIKQVSKTGTELIDASLLPSV
jgi:rhodanese-related sulfurtransferase